MPGSDPKTYYLQRGELTNVSDPKKVQFKTKNLAGAWVTIENIDWETQVYPNKQLERLPNDTQGMLKPKSNSLPKLGVGALYLSEELCTGLQKGKYPSELAGQPGFYRHAFTARSLLLSCVNANGDDAELDLLMSSRADLGRGITWEGDKLVVWISAEAYEDIGQTAPEGAEPAGGPTAPSASGAVTAANPQLARLALEYCTTLPDTQLRAALVPLLKLLAGPG